MIGSFERAITFHGFFQVQQKRAEAIAFLLAGAVINFQPAGRGFDWRGACADAGAVPFARSGPREADVPAPVEEVGRLREPDVVAADLRAGRAVQGKIATADFLFKQRSNPCYGAER